MLIQKDILLCIHDWQIAKMYISSTFAVVLVERLGLVSGVSLIFRTFDLFVDLSAGSALSFR